MDLARIAGANHTFSPPPGWDEATMGPCPVLTLRLVKDSGGETVAISAWKPTDAERELIAKGAPVLLYLWGDVHPRVAIHAGEAP